MSGQTQTTHAVNPPNARFPRPASDGVLKAALWRIIWCVAFRTGIGGNRWRVMLLRLFGAQVHPTVAIAASVWIDYPWNLSIGCEGVISHRVKLNCNGSIHVGQRVRISQYTYICTHTHDTTTTAMTIRCLPVTVGDDVWIGADTYIDPGVTIGPRTVVGARTSVMNDAPADAIVVGNPGTAVRRREGNASPVA